MKRIVMSMAVCAMIFTTGTFFGQTTHPAKTKKVRRMQKKTLRKKPVKISKKKTLKTKRLRMARKKPIALEKLPEKIQKTVAKKYRDAKIKTAYRLNRRKGKVYKLELDNHKTLLYSQGKLKEIKPLKRSRSRRLHLKKSATKKQLKMRDSRRVKKSGRVGH